MYHALVRLPLMHLVRVNFPTVVPQNSTVEVSAMCRTWFIVYLFSG
jgi:hypothetical protein